MSFAIRICSFITLTAVTIWRLLASLLTFDERCFVAYMYIYKTCI